MQKALIAAVLSLSMLLAPQASLAEPQPAVAPRVVNVTTDSSPGWIPSVDQERAALEAFAAYYAFYDAGQFAQAHQLFAAINRASTPLAEFEANGTRFRAEAGAVLERSLRKLTWTKDSPRAPLPGVYAALDISSRFKNIDRHCGFLILYQNPEGGPFRVMREESNFITNAAASQFTPENLATAWAQVSARCPNLN